MKIITAKARSNNTDTTQVTSDGLDLSMEVVAGLQRMGLTSQAAQIMDTAHSIQQSTSLGTSDNDSQHSTASVDTLALDHSAVYTDSDLRKLRRVARACIEDNKHTKSAKQLLCAISAYREQQRTDTDTDADTNSDVEQ